MTSRKSYLAVLGATFVVTTALLELGYPTFRRKVIASFHYTLSRVVEIGRIPPRFNNHYLRSEFRESETPKIKVSTDHTHPVSAAWRSSTVVLARSICAKLGLQPFVYQASTSDVKDGMQYSRDYRWMKDINVPVSNSQPGPNSLLVIVDVDYYVDMPGVLLDNDNPVLLYTFQPRAAASEKGEFSFRFNKDNKVQYDVSGGASYHHDVWDYSKDVITVSNIYKTSSYIVERRLANEHHEYILFIPIGTWRFGYSWIANCLHSDGLNYLKINQGEFNVLDIKTKDGITRSIAKVGHYNCANLQLSKFNALESVNRTSKLAIGNASVQSWMDNDKPGAAVVVEYLRSTRLETVPLVYPAAEGVRGYQILKKPTDLEEGRPLMVSYMSPLLPACFVPHNTPNNEKAAIEGRIIIPKAEANSLVEQPISKYLIDEFTKFVELLIPQPNLAIPVSVEEVYERQARPSQKTGFAQAEISYPHRVAETFLKAEPYQKISDPRIITTFNTTDKREYSRFIYALAAHVKEFHWYSFGKTPIQIAESVAEICTNSIASISCADANRMDGHVHSSVRQLERMILLRFFSLDLASTIIDLHGAHYNLRAYTKSGIPYPLDDARGSGSADTALFNTILSKFIDYLTRRMQGQMPTLAFNALGQFAGDDSISPDLQGTTLVRAGAMVGQVLENVVFLKGSPGVNYLSRFYTTDVWFGDPASTCDLARTLSKLHVTTALNRGVTPLMKLHEKLSGLALSDRHSPIIQQIIQVAERVGMSFPNTAIAGSSSWWSRFDSDVNWPNEPINDQDDWIETFIPDSDCWPLIDYLDNVKIADQLLTMPAIKSVDAIPILYKTMAMVDDNILNCPPITVAPTQPISPIICKAFLERKCTFGSKCKYSHIKVCNDFLAGRCKRTSCKFSHSQ